MIAANHGADLARIWLAARVLVVRPLARRARRGNLPPHDSCLSRIDEAEGLESRIVGRRTGVPSANPRVDEVQRVIAKIDACRSCRPVPADGAVDDVRDEVQGNAPPGCVHPALQRIDLDDVADRRTSRTHPLHRASALEPLRAEDGFIPPLNCRPVLRSTQERLHIAGRRCRPRLVTRLARRPEAWQQAAHEPEVNGHVALRSISVLQCHLALAQSVVATISISRGSSAGLSADRAS
jgi:hypothetical protein